MPFGSACWATWPAWCKSLTALLSLPAACAASHCCGPSLEWAAVNCEEWDEAQVEQLLRFLHLSSLHLRSYFRMPAAACGVLARMPQLRRLELYVQDLDLELASIAKLTQLSSLSLAVYDPLGDGMDMSPLGGHEPPLLQLTQLQCLRHLTIVHKGTDYRLPRRAAGECRVR